MNLPRRIKIFGLISLGIVGICLLAWLFYFRIIRYTDDAYVEGNQIILTPLRKGFITDIYSDDTFLATKDQVLIQLDETDSILAFQEAKDNLASTVRKVCRIYHEAFAYDHQIQIDRAELLKAYQDWTHRINVIDQGGVSLEDLEHAIAALKAAYYKLEMTKSLYLKETSLIQSESIRSNPMVQEAASKFIYAAVELYRCKIHSPVEGLVAQRTAQVGMWTKPGEPLLSIIPLDQIWVNANFKETQMKHMRIGQEVDVTSDLYGPTVVYHGKIVGLPGGAGNAFSILPPQNLSGNWIKIVQRLPVRIALDPKELKKHPLRIGLSMHAIVKIRKKGKLVPENSLGSPHYTTEIYTKETEGSAKLSEQVILDNLDPTLSHYLDRPFEVAMLDDHFEEILESL
jgi:membrane fusion protein (multidrug efflux system)